MLNSKGCWYSGEVRNANSTSVFISDVAVCCVNTLLVILSLLSNGYVVYRYSKTKSRQPVSNTLLFVLASFDLLQSITSQPVFIISVVLKLQKIFVCELHDASKTIFAMFAGFSFFMAAVVLTSERLLAVVFPIRHRVHLRKTHVVGISLIVFVLWGGFVVVMLHVVNNRTFFRPITASTIGVSLVYALAVYVKIYFVCRKCKKRQQSPRKQKASVSIVSAKSMENPGIQREKTEINQVGQNGIELKIHERQKITDGNRSEMSSQTANNRINIINRENRTSITASQFPTIAKDVSLSRREKKTIIRMFSILGSLFMCNLPAVLLFTHASYYDIGYLTVSYFAPWTRTVVFLNTIINPVLYCYRNEHFHKRKLLYDRRS